MLSSRKSLPLILLALFAVATLLAACGGGSKETGDVTVSLADYRFDPNEVRIKAGQTVKVLLKNVGAVAHDFSVPDINLRSGELAPRETKTVEMTFSKAGEYKLVCTVPGHEDLGMVGKIIVSD